LDEGEWKVE